MALEKGLEPLAQFLWAQVPGEAVDDRTDGTTGSQPQLLVAVASTRPLNMLRPSGPAGADQVFPAALAEAQRNSDPAAATARYFRLER